MPEWDYGCQTDRNYASLVKKVGTATSGNLIDLPSVTVPPLDGIGYE